MTYSFEGASLLVDATRTPPAPDEDPGTVLGYWKGPGGWGIDPVNLLTILEKPEPLGGWVRGCEGFFDGTSWVLVADGAGMVEFANELGLPHVPSEGMIRWVRERLLSWLLRTYPGQLESDALPGSGVPSWLDLAEAMNPTFSRDELLTWIRCARRQPVGVARHPYWWLVVPEDPAVCFEDRDMVRLRGLTPLPSRVRDQRDLVPWPDHSGADLQLENYRHRRSLAVLRLDREGVPPGDVSRVSAAAAEYLWWTLWTLESLVTLVRAWIDEERLQSGGQPRLIADDLERVVLEIRRVVEDPSGPMPNLPDDVDMRVVDLHHALLACERAERQVAALRSPPSGIELDPMIACVADALTAARSLGDGVRFRDDHAPNRVN